MHIIVNFLCVFSLQQGTANLRYYNKWVAVLLKVRQRSLELLLISKRALNIEAEKRILGLF